MTKTEIKRAAQSHLMQSLQCAFIQFETYTGPFGVYKIEDADEIRKAMCEQFERIEKQFGYIPGSWNKGC